MKFLIYMTLFKIYFTEVNAFKTLLKIIKKISSTINYKNCIAVLTIDYVEYFVGVLFINYTPCNIKTKLISNYSRFLLLVTQNKFS